MCEGFTMREILEDLNEEACTADGFDDAIIGIAERACGPAVVAYDYHKVIGIMMNRDGMSWEEAVEYYDYNIIGSWIGEAATPVFITLYDGIDGGISYENE